MLEYKVQTRSLNEQGLPMEETYMSDMGLMQWELVNILYLNYKLLYYWKRKKVHVVPVDSR